MNQSGTQSSIRTVQRDFLNRHFLLSLAHDESKAILEQGLQHQPHSALRNIAFSFRVNVEVFSFDPIRPTYQLRLTNAVREPNEIWQRLMCRNEPASWLHILVPDGAGARCVTFYRSDFERWTG